MFKLYKVWNNKNSMKWQALRKNGAASFAINFGIIQWGSWMFTFLTIFHILITNDKTVTGYLNIIFNNLLICGLFGYIYGMLIFHYTDKSFKKYCNE